MATVGRPSNSDANFFASLQDHSHDDSQPSEAEPAEKTRTPPAPVQRASGPALSRWGLQDHALADRCLLKIRADQVLPTDFRAMGLAGDSFSCQLLTITLVPQINMKGIVTLVCRMSQHRHQCPRCWVIGLRVTRHPSHALTRSLIIMSIFGE